jgi:hypothetical protein
VLLGQLGARGDCLYATAIARQIKHDLPDCHLTWAVGSMCRAIVEGNPYVDEIWEFPMANHGEMIAAWETFHRRAEARRAAGDFDEIFYTQIYPDNFKNFDGTVRASIFRGYPHRITVPITPIIRLNQKEVLHVENFVNLNDLGTGAPVILFEYSGNSGQSFVDFDFAETVALLIVKKHPLARVILASHQQFKPAHPRIICGSRLSFKENAELTKYCTLLVGCSSGLSWLATSDWAKPLPSVQLLSRHTSVFASFVHDHTHFGLPVDGIIEITDCLPEHVAACIDAILLEGFSCAQARFHQDIKPDFRHYVDMLQFAYSRSGLGSVLRSLKVTIGRYGIKRELLQALGRVLGSRLQRRDLH